MENEFVKIRTNNSVLFHMQSALSQYKILIGDKEFTVNGDRCLAPHLTDIIRTTMAFLRQSVYVPLLITECFIHNIEESIKKKTFFKFGIKKRWNECVTGLTTTLKDFEAFAPDDSFDEAFAFARYDIASDDIIKLRNLIADKLSKACGDKAGSYANVVVVYNLLTFSVISYEEIMQMVYDQIQVNFVKPFRAFSGIPALESSFHLMEQVLGKDKDYVSRILETKAVEEAFETVRVKICGHEAYVKAAKMANKETTGVAKMCDMWYAEDLLSPHGKKKPAV